MAEIALEIQKDALRDPMVPILHSTFTDALDTVSTHTPFTKTERLQMLIISRYDLTRRS